MGCHFILQNWQTYPSPKFIWKYKGPRTGKIILKRKTQIWKIVLSKFETYNVIVQIVEYTDTGLNKIKNFYFLKDMVKKWNGKLGENIYSICNQQKVCIQKMYKGPKFKNKKVSMQLKIIKINNIWKFKKTKMIRMNKNLTKVCISITNELIEWCSTSIIKKM